MPGAMNADDGVAGLLEEHDDHIALSTMPQDQSTLAVEALRRGSAVHLPWKKIMDGTERGGGTVSTKLARVALSWLKLRMPFLAWVPELTLSKLRADLIAGLTIGVMVIPQGMSYANVAGCPYVVGLYTAFIPPFVYAFFGTSRQLVVGPVAMESLLIFAGLRGIMTPQECPKSFKNGVLRTDKTQAQLCPDMYMEYVVTSTFAVGILEIGTCLCGAAFLLRFMGQHVVTGFTAGSAVVIMTSQLKDVFGIKIPATETVQETVKYIISMGHRINGLALGWAVALVLYLIAHKWVTARYKKYLWPIQPFGPLLVIIVCACIMNSNDYLQNKLPFVGKIPAGLPHYVPINFGLLTKVLPTALSAFVVGDMEAIAIGRGLAAKNGYAINSNQELLAQGISNIVGSFFRCYTATGSFSRSAVNHGTGAKTQLSAWISSVVIMLTLLFLTKLFYWVPKIALAAVVISSVIPLLHIDTAIRLFKVSKLDFFVWAVSALVVMFVGIVQGIGAGVGISLAIVIYESSRPQLSILWRIPGTTIYRSIKQESSGTFVPHVFICRVGSSLYFANVGFVKDKLRKYLKDLESVSRTEYVVLEMTPVTTMDSCASTVFEEVVRDFRKSGIEVAFAMVGTRCHKCMENTGLLNAIGENWIFSTVNEAVNHCLRHRHLKLSGDGQLALDSEPTTIGKSIDEDGAVVPISSLGLQREVRLGNEVGVSNDMHGFYTVVFVNLVDSAPNPMSTLVSFFEKENLLLKRAVVEEVEGRGVWKHRYFLQSGKTKGKLSIEELVGLQRQCGALISAAVENPEQI